MAKIDFAWELGAGTGHVTTLLPVAAAMQSRGHDVRFLLRDLSAGADLEGAGAIPREGAPIWTGPATVQAPLNLGEILLNFGYHHAPQHKQLVDAWRERLQGSQAVVANVAPAAHLAARTLGIPSFEISQGFHAPPPAMPSPPLRHWEPAPRARLEAADRQVLQVINTVLSGYGARPIATLGELFAGRLMLLTYPELDIYPERGPSDYYGITDSGEGKAVPQWPSGSGPRLFAYLYSYFKGLDPLLAAIAARKQPALVFCRGIDAKLKEKYAGSSIHFSAEAMSVTRLLPQADMVVCHASHQMTAQALLAGKPVLLLPTQLEQFLIMRRLVRFGAGLGIAPEVPNADYAAALNALAANRGYCEKAREFAQRYAGHSRDAALSTMIGRIEAALAPPSR
jgi:UDP:flavonoid glycosyltransferase YjiC (YdhE family)